MSYEWQLDPKGLFLERYPQMTRQSLPAADVDRVRASITHMWADNAGGWVHEWSNLAQGYANEGRHDLATVAYGWAKFPTLANEASRQALENQVVQYELWSREFPIDFDRRVLEVSFAGGTTQVPVHVLSPKDAATDTPVILASGGVDTWKMDLHPIFQLFAQRTGARVMAFDIPGTGESRIPLSSESAQVVSGLVAQARRLGARKVVHVGISMGGYFSARTGLAREVEAAVVLGGPVGSVPGSWGRDWHFGMADIMGNALRMDRPTKQEVARAMEALNLRVLLEQDDNAPMLVVNGADDVHIPQRDTLVFRGRKDTRVELLEGTGHCAVTRMDEVLPLIISWLAEQLR